MMILQNRVTRTTLQAGLFLLALRLGLATEAAAQAPAARALATKAATPDGFPAARTPSAIKAWLKTSTDIAPASVISIGADMVVATAKPGSLDTATGHVLGAELRGEAISAAFTKIIHGRSSLASLDADCAQSSALIHQTRIYSESNLKGEVTILPGGSDWINPPKTAYLYEAIDALCHADFKRPLSDAPVSASVSVSASAVSTSVNATAAGPEAQVVAAASAQAAEAFVKDMARHLPQAAGEHPFRVATALVNGKTYYRGLFGGFADKAAAAAFCKSLTASGKACMVR